MNYECSLDKLREIQDRLRIDNKIAAVALITALLLLSCA